MALTSWQVLVNGILPILKNCAVLLVFSFDNSLYILETSSLSDICFCKDFLPFCGLSFFLSTVSFKEQGFLF